ncbi:MAG TPA: hypothetical protein VHO66_04690 [Ruminiclostridium sp.]|nr:hypothetical protein [Ruminiclostridium sp.]
MNRISDTAIGIFDHDGHLTAKSIEALRDGDLCGEILTQALSHIGCCEKCAEAFATAIEQQGLMEVPFGFDEEFQNKLSKEKESKYNYAFYVLRVAIAACVALIITFSTVFNSAAGYQNKINKAQSPDFSFVNSINTHLRDFSQNVINLEVFKNAEKKK